MKFVWLLPFVFVSQLSFAGVILESSKGSYSIGETVELDVSYQVDDMQTFTEITDFDFGLNFDESLASFNQVSFSSPYNTTTWVNYYDDLLKSGTSILFDISANPFDSTTKTSWSLFSVTFTAIDAGIFDFSLDYLDLYDYNLNLVDSLLGSKQVEIVSAEVSEPGMFSLSTLALASVFFMRKRKLTHKRWA